MFNQDQIFQTISNIQSSVSSSTISNTVLDIRDRDITLFLGNTRAGKSTTVNYVIGNNLQAVHVTKKKYNIINMDGEFTGPAIGKGSTSETAIPSAWISSKISGLIVDAPGFDDNRGEAQDIINAFNIKEILESASSVKFVLITDINDITSDNVAQFCKFIDTVKIILPQVELLLNGMVLVFTKDEDSTTIDEVSDLMYEKIINKENFIFLNKKIIQYFADHKNQIVVVKMPTNEGPLHDKDIFDDLINTIKWEAKNLPKEILVNITPGISERSRLFLHEAKTKLFEFRRFEDVLSDISNKISNILKEYEHHVDNIITANSELSQLKNFNHRVDNLMNSSSGVIDSLTEMRTFSGESTMQDLSDIENIIQFLKFVDKLLHTDTSNNFLIKIKCVLSNVSSNIVKSISNKNERINQLITAENERKAEARAKEELRLQQELKALQKQQRKQELELELLRLKSERRLSLWKAIELTIRIAELDRS